MSLWIGGQPAMAGLPFVRDFRMRVVVTEEHLEVSGVEVEMIGTRSKKPKLDYRWFLERLGREDRREIAALEEFVKGSSENPEFFLEEWLRPLLRHGLSLERAYEVVIESVIWPN
jgi:hypothetical protein